MKYQVNYTYSQMRKVAHSYLKENQTMLFILGFLSLLSGAGVAYSGNIFAVALTGIIDVLIGFVVMNSAMHHALTLDDLLNNRRELLKAFLRYILVTLGIGILTAVVAFGAVLVASLFGIFNIGAMSFMMVVIIMLTYWFVIYLSMRLFIILQVLLHDPSKTTMEAIKYSFSLMKGNCMNAFGYSLSYIGWILLSIVTLGFGLIYVYPLMIAGDEVYYQALTQRAIEENSEN